MSRWTDPDGRSSAWTSIALNAAKKVHASTELAPKLERHPHAPSSVDPKDSLPVDSPRPAGPITVEQITDHDTYVVQVSLAPTPDLVTALCRALDGRSGLRALVSHVAPENPEHQRALRELTVILEDTFTVTLTPGQAAVVESALYYAAGEPAKCVHCQDFAVVAAPDNLCGGHARALDQVDLWDREPS